MERITFEASAEGGFTVGWESGATRKGTSTLHRVEVSTVGNESLQETVKRLFLMLPAGSAAQFQAHIGGIAAAWE